MRSRQTTLSPLLRSLAAATLLLWLSAQVFCTSHCSGGGHTEAEHPSCHGPVKSHHDDGDSSRPAHDDSSASASCLTLKTALLNGSSLALVQPEFSVIYTLAPFVVALDVAMTEPASLFFRQAGTRVWVFTPEVCLGPAFRSQAPPLLS